MPVRAMDRGLGRYADAHGECSVPSSADSTVPGSDHLPQERTAFRMIQPAPSRLRRSSSNSRCIRSRSAWAASCATFASFKASAIASVARCLGLAFFGFGPCGERLP